MRAYVEMMPNHPSQDDHLSWNSADPGGENKYQLGVVTVVQGLLSEGGDV